MKQSVNSLQHLRYEIFNTKAGWIGVLSSDIGCLRTTLPQKSSEQAATELGSLIDLAERSPGYFRDLKRNFEAYFCGDRVDFAIRLDLSQATSFERSVWETTCCIPYGETQSYAWIARRIGKPQAPRAVGQALGRNPLPILVPCHRVLTSDGKLGGFGGGLPMKQFLLALETGHRPSSSL